MKLCKDCKHARAGGAIPISPFGSAYFEWMCLHPDMREPVVGNPGWKCEAARASNSTSLCGPAGALWEEGTPAESPYLTKAPEETPDAPAEELSLTLEQPVSKSLWKKLTTKGKA